MDVKINAQEWNSLSPDEQAEISNIVTGYFKGARVIPDSSVAATGVQSNPWCVIACNAAEAAAVQACQRISNPAARAACVAAAQAGGAACRSRC